MSADTPRIVDVAIYAGLGVAAVSGVLYWVLTRIDRAVEW